MSIDLLTHSLSSTLCTAAMHIGSHSIHYTAMRQASKQTNTEHNKTRLDSTRFDVSLLFGVLRENAVYSGEECVVYVLCCASFFFPTVFSTTSHSTPYRRATASACIHSFVVWVYVCYSLYLFSLLLIRFACMGDSLDIILFLVVLCIDYAPSFCLCLLMWSFHWYSHTMGFSAA